MSATTAYQASIVRYSGSMAAFHGLMILKYVLPSGAVLRSAWGDKLQNVRAASYTPVDAPALTDNRVHALRNLQDGRKADARAVGWLIANKLAERKDEGAVKPTDLGWIIAQAHRFSR